MRCCADENVAPKLARFIRDFLLSKAHTLDTVDDHQARGVEDEIWVRKFAAAGGQAIVTGDAAMMARPHEVAAIKEAGLILIVLPKNWTTWRLHLQLAHLAFWWPRIEATLAVAKAPSCYRVPKEFSEKAQLALERVDYDAAYRKLRREKGRSGG